MVFSPLNSTSPPNRMCMMLTKRNQNDYEESSENSILTLLLIEVLQNSRLVEELLKGINANIKPTFKLKLCINTTVLDNINRFELLVWRALKNMTDGMHTMVLQMCCHRLNCQENLRSEYVDPTINPFTDLNEVEIYTSSSTLKENLKTEVK